MQTTFTTALLFSATQAFYWDPKSDPPVRSTSVQTVAPVFDVVTGDLIEEGYNYEQCNIGDACWLDGCDTSAIIKRPSVTVQTYKECIESKNSLMGDVDGNV